MEKTLDIVGCLNGSATGVTLENTRHRGVGIFGSRIHVCSAQFTCLVNTFHSDEDTANDYRRDAFEEDVLEGATIEDATITDTSFSPRRRSNTANSDVH